MDKPTLKQRISAAWRVFNNGFRMERKEIPYEWPAFRLSTPDWGLTNVQAYINEGFSQNSLIYSAIMYKVRAMTAASILAYDEDDEPLPPEDQLVQLLERPNPYQGWTQFHSANIVYLNVAGNCFICMDRKAKDALPQAMYTMRPDRVRIVPGTRGTIKGYIYVPEGKAVADGVPFLPQDIMHVKFPNPGDELEGLGYGLSPISAMARSADVDNSVTKFIKLFFDKGTVIYGMLQFDQPLDDATINKIRERWKEVYGGYENWADIGILDNAGKYQRVGMTFEEMGFETLDERNETRVLSTLGVPPILIGSRTGLARATYSNYEEARQAFWEDTMIPETRLFESGYNYYLGSPGVKIAFDYSKVPALQNDIGTQATAAYQLWQMGVPANDALSAAGVELTVPNGDTSYLPLSVMPQGSSRPAPAEPEAAPETGEEEENVEATEDERVEEPKQRKAGGLSVEAKANHWKAVDRIARSWEKKFEDGAVDAFGADERALLAILNDGKAAAYTEKRTVSWDAIQDSAKEYLRGPSRKQWVEKFKPLIAGLMEDQAENIERTFFSGGKEQRKQFTAAEWFAEYMLIFAQPISDTTEGVIAALLAQAQEDGWSIPMTMSHLESVFEQFSQGDLSAEDFDWFAERMPAYRRENIGRTETIRASNAASEATYREFGATRKEWLATLDDRCRPEHLAANGQVVGIDESFSVGGEEMMYPGDPNGSPGNFCNCRCSIAPVMGE